MLKFLKEFFAGFGGIFGNLFSLFSVVVLTVARLPKAVLDTCGFIPSVPIDTAGDVAERALAEARSNRSSLDRCPAKILTPYQRQDVISQWAEWKINGKIGPEPILDCLTLREKLRLRQAHNNELQALSLRCPSEVESWLNGLSPRFAPLTPTEAITRAHGIAKARQAAGKVFADQAVEMDEQEHYFATVRAERVANDQAIADGFRLLGISPVLEADAQAPRPRFAYA